MNTRTTIHRRLGPQRVGANLPSGRPTSDARPSHGQTGVNVSAMTSHPMAAMISAQGYSQQLAMQELNGLAAEQQASNQALARLRAVEDKLRSILMDGEITSAELDELEAFAREAGVDIGDFLSAVRSEISASGGGKVAYSEYGDGEGERKLRGLVKSLREQLGRRRDDIKGEASSRELDIQRASQELAIAMQLQSNLSKRWSDTLNAIVANMR